MRRAPETSIYDCGICLSLPDDAVHQCRSGHLFCAPCLATHYASGSANSKKCPTCRVALHATPIRCLSAEHAIAEMSTVCHHCAQNMTRGELKEHVPSCPKRPVKCSAEACEARVPCDELQAHERSCVHVTCAAALGRIEATFRTELAATEQRLRTEYRRAMVEEYVMSQFRECARHPPGPSFRVELVRPDANANWLSTIQSDLQVPGDSRNMRQYSHAQGYFNRLLCLVPGVEGTIHEGGCYPVLLVYSTAEPHRGYGLSAQDAVQAGVASTSFRMGAPVARLPALEGPRMATRHTRYPLDPLGAPAWGAAQPSAEDLAAADAADRTDPRGGNVRYVACGFCHPNVYPSGKVCLSILDEEKSWHPSMTAAEILLSIQALLDDPNFADPAQEEPYRMGKYDRMAYNQRVREQAARYTAEEFDQLVTTYCRSPIRSGRRNANGSSDPEWTADGQHRIIIGQGG
jgi:hypothetical protein